jgi:hypothetical protein
MLVIFRPRKRLKTTRLSKDVAQTIDELGFENDGGRVGVCAAVIGRLFGVAVLS